MKNDRIASGILFLVGAITFREGSMLRYVVGTTAGPGFLPIWLGGIMMLLAVLLFATTRERNRPFIDSPQGLRRAATVALSFLVFALALGYVGMIVSIALYIAFLLAAVERRTWRECATAGLAISAGCFVVFKLWLGLQLPGGIFGI